MITVAIIGAGIGAQHLLGYLDIADRFRVKTICDLDESRGRALANKGSNANWTADYHAVLADADIDLVDICLPPHLHFEAAMQALDAGKHVICEKPLVASLAECDQLIERAQIANCLVSPVFQYRYGIGSAQLQALIDADLTGRCFTGTLETHWDRQASYYDIPWRGTWKGERGGAVLGHAIHIHDLLTCFLGPTQKVHAELATRVNDIEVEDCAALAIRMASGAVITSSITLGAADNTSRMRLNFEKLTVETDNAPYSPAAKPWHFNAREPYSQIAIDEVLANVVDPGVGYIGMFNAVADALDGKAGREVTLVDGRQSLAFVTAVYASSRHGKPEATDIKGDHTMYVGWVS